ncbi:MAG: RNA-directed DNA polymerase [Verrucomicrobia bacterium]|nr:RNA-directed DNA polymerase [Verrucomicrobiota bacterium]
MTPTEERWIASLAKMALAGEWEAAALLERGQVWLGSRPRWWLRLVHRLLRQFGPGTRPRLSRVESFLRRDPWLRKVLLKGDLKGDANPPEPVQCAARGRPATWKLPSFTRPVELASWLRVSVGELEWLADAQGWRSGEACERLGHYHYRWLRKRDGSARLIESPKQHLKLIQRGLLDAVVSAIPAHESAHGFQPGRSTLTHVGPHIGREVVLKYDLRDFFTRVTRPRVQAVFRTAGYPEAVAALLAALCTHRTPARIWRQFPGFETDPLIRARARNWQCPHLPQGAPTSPALANLVAYRLDCRLAGLAKAAGASYTRYADDLLFSGGSELARGAERFGIMVGAIALEEGFELNTRKTRVLRRGVAQRAVGLVLNDRINVPRAEYDRLKAILHHCVRQGPAGQNREGVPDFAAHLAGRVAYVTQTNPQRGARLQQWLDQIDWSRSSESAAAT